MPCGAHAHPFPGQRRSAPLRGVRDPFGDCAFWQATANPYREDMLDDVRIRPIALGDAGEVFTLQRAARLPAVELVYLRKHLTKPENPLTDSGNAPR